MIAFAREFAAGYDGVADFLAAVCDLFDAAALLAADPQ